ALVMTGERSNTLKIFLGIIIFFLFFDFFKVKTKIIIFLLFTFLFGLIISQSEYLKIRYVGQIYEKVNNKENLKKFVDDNIYIRLYKSGYSVFKNYPFFGVGNKNYRIETCKNKNDQLKFNYKCLTHPHQLYFEFLSEHGLVGTIIILSILFYLMYMILKSIILSRNYIQVGSFIFVLVNFTPLLPSGSFFSDFNITLFWINFSIMFACNKKTNIFAKNSI
ncbi:O-antigen ligase family protein, partial [Candidatus Pelagibacter sp.]|nr:O-antigen ligase family protein [Candidatus Pelagibacter sp.]